ncbi:AsmA family protein [Wolbachia endosymbiont of Pentidionis agamae]
MSVSLILYVISVFIDLNKYKSVITEELEKIYNAKIFIGGKVEVSIINTEVIIHNVYIKPNASIGKHLSELVTIDKLKIKPAILSLLTFSFKPKSITIYGIKSNKSNLSSMIQIKINDNLTDVVIKKGSIFLEENFSEDGIITIEDVNIKNKKSKKEIFGKINLANRSYAFSSKIDVTQQNIDIQADSELLKLKLVGNKKQEFFNGNLTLKINNNTNIFSKLIKASNVNLLSYLIPKESITISSNLEINKEEFIYSDLKINSDSIEANGKFNRNIKSNNIDININRLKLDTFLNYKENIQIKDLLESLNTNVTKNLNLNLVIEAKNVNYYDTILSNLHVSAQIANGIGKINSSLNLPKVDSKLLLSGKISNNRTLSQFDGNLSINGSDFSSALKWLAPSIEVTENKKSKFSLNSRLHIAPKIFLISDIEILSNQEVYQGTIKVKYTKKNNNVVDGELNIYNLNLNKYSYPLEKSLPRIKWIIGSKTHLNISANVNDLILNNSKIRNLSFLLYSQENELITDIIRMHGDHLDAVGKIKALIIGKTPSIKVDIKGDKFNGNLLKPLGLIKNKTNLVNHTIEWSKEQFNFLDGFQNFNGNINIHIKEFKTKNSNLKDFSLDAEFKNRIFTIKQLNYLSEDYDVALQGYVRIDKEYAIHTRFFISDLKVNNILGTRVQGKVNLSGAINAQGKSMYDAINNSFGQISLEGKKINFSNINLDSFISKLLLVKSKSEIIALTNSDMYNGNTLFKKIVGRGDIKDGICSTSLTFHIEKASVSMSANILLLNATMVSIFRLFFIPNHQSDPVHIDMHIDGQVLNPKISFEVDKIYSTLFTEKDKK